MRVPGKDTFVHVHMSAHTPLCTHIPQSICSTLLQVQCAWAGQAWIQMRCGKGTLLIHHVLSGMRGTHKILVHRHCLWFTKLHGVEPLFGLLLSIVLISSLSLNSWAWMRRVRICAQCPGRCISEASTSMRSCVTGLCQLATGAWQELSGHSKPYGSVTRACWSSQLLANIFLNVLACTHALVHSEDHSSIFWLSSVKKICSSFENHLNCIWPIIGKMAWAGLHLPLNLCVCEHEWSTSTPSCLLCAASGFICSWTATCGGLSTHPMWLVATVHLHLALVEGRKRTARYLCQIQIQKESHSFLWKRLGAEVLVCELLRIVCLCMRVHMCCVCPCAPFWPTLRFCILDVRKHWPCMTLCS